MERPTGLYWKRWALALILLLIAVGLLALGSGVTRIAGTIVGVLALFSIPFTFGGKT